ncbi:MAG TPA: hypothetical protein VMF09_11125 [Solirubrobacteraceae bacterium]|nr:hypothetical protein [Solirubrobacteraceae bacterium]
MPTSGLLFGGTPSHGYAQAAAAPTPPSPPPGLAPPSGSAPGNNNTLTVIAGVGVLLLAMGVGVLIGRAGAPKQGAVPPQTISVAQSAPPAGTSTAAEASFTSSWPSGTSGFTVQLQTLAQAGTAVSAVEAAKTAATTKGAKAVGALKSEEFSSLPSGSYVIYSGVYHKRAEAEKALGALKKSFAGAKVIKVSDGGSSAVAESGEPASSSSGAVGSSESHPAPPSVLNTEKGAKGKSYSEKSKELPDVVETG